MERVTLEKLRSGPGLFERLTAEARGERTAIVGACCARLGAMLLRRVYNKRSSRDVATERTCSEKACSTANAS